MKIVKIDDKRVVITSTKLMSLVDQVVETVNIGRTSIDDMITLVWEEFSRWIFESYDRKVDREYFKQDLQFYEWFETVVGNYYREDKMKKFILQLIDKYNIK